LEYPSSVSYLSHRIPIEENPPALLVPDPQTAQKGGSMNEELENELNDDLRPEYDFASMAGGVRGKYVDSLSETLRERYRTGTNVVLLEPDVAAAFPTAESVNEALRVLIADRHQNQVIPAE
jgi:hypothetical protein